MPCCTKPCFGRLSEYGVAVYPQAASADQPVLSPPRAALPSASRRVCRRLGARYSQSLLSGRRAASIPAKEPNQEPTQADTRRHPATPGDCQAWSSAH